MRPCRALLAAGLLPVAVGGACWGRAVALDARLAAPAPTAIVLDRDGAFLTQAGHETVRADGGRQVEYGFWRTAPPPRVVAATLALEDRRFWSHPGVDPLAVLRAGWQRLLGRSGSGASTIAMQVARMQHPRPRTLWAKGVEAGVAVALTLRYGRAAVLAQYLRLAPYGEGSHGIGHAARWFFDRPAADLDWTQAALLAALPQSPARLRLRHPDARLHRRAALALAALSARGALPPGELPAAEAALDAPGLVAGRHRPPWLPVVLRLQRLARALPPAPEPLLRATLDGALQDRVQAMAAAELRGWQPLGARQAAVMVTRRGTREVLAAVSVSAGASGSAIDFTRAERSPGSTLKPFLFARALDRDLLAAQDVLADSPEEAAGISNADHAFLGPILPRQALANSRNVPAALLLRRLGLQDGFDFLRTLGLHRLDGSAGRFGLAMAIGALPTRLDRLMRAYATLAEDGWSQDLLWLRDGRRDPPQRLVSRDTARLVARFLSDPMARLPSFPRYGASEYPFVVALKTGTSQGYRDAWTLAWSGQYEVGAWVGRADGGPMSRLSGTGASGVLVQSLLLRLHGNANRTELVAGDLPAPAGAERELCTVTGAAAPCPTVLREFVRDGATPAAPAPAPVLAITRPDDDLHVWRNPEVPAALDRLVLRARASGGAGQIVWLVDGVPQPVSDADAPFLWPLQPGHHVFQLRLPLSPVLSRPVRVVVE